MTSAHSDSAPKPPTPARLMDLSGAFQHSCLLFAASDAGVFAWLSEHPGSTAGAVGEACGLSTRTVRLLLDACAAIDLLTKDGDMYRNAADVDAFLVPGRPGDLSRAIRYNRDVLPAWSHLPELIRTGRPVEAPSLHLGDDAERTRAFVLAMHGRAMAIGRAVVPRINLAGCRSVLDVGGGSGAYSMLIAQANPAVHCTLMDLPGVAAVARELVRQAGLDARVGVLDGDYHVAAFPAGQDAVLLFGMLHQESPASILDLLRRARAALKPGGRIYVLDLMTDASRCRPPFSALFAVNMALTTDNGWVFSDEDILGWMREAGLSDVSCRPLPPPMPHWLAEGSCGGAVPNP